MTTSPGREFERLVDREAEPEPCMAVVRIAGCYNPEEYCNEESVDGGFCARHEAEQRRDRAESAWADAVWPVLR